MNEIDLNEILSRLELPKQDIFLISVLGDFASISENDLNILRDKKKNISLNIDRAYSTIEQIKERIDELEDILSDLNRNKSIGALIIRYFVESEILHLKKQVLLLKPNTLLLEKVNMSEKIKLLELRRELFIKVMDQKWHRE